MCGLYSGVFISVLVASNAANRQLKRPNSAIIPRVAHFCRESLTVVFWSCNRTLVSNPFNSSDWLDWRAGHYGHARALSELSEVQTTTQCDRCGHNSLATAQWWQSARQTLLARTGPARTVSGPSRPGPARINSSQFVKSRRNRSAADGKEQLEKRRSHVQTRVGDGKRQREAGTVTIYSVTSIANGPLVFTVAARDTLHSSSAAFLIF